MEAFDVLGDPVRRRILELLADGERASGEVTAVDLGGVRHRAAGGLHAAAGAARERLRRRPGRGPAKALRDQRRPHGRGRRLARPSSGTSGSSGSMHSARRSPGQERGHAPRGDHCRWTALACRHMTAFVDDFDGPELDTDVWLPHYLPMWSSLEATRASYRLEDSCLVLDIPPEPASGCQRTIHPPLRLSGMQSGNRSGPVGSTDGQQAVYAGRWSGRSSPTSRGISRTADTSRSAAG